MTNLDNLKSTFGNKLDQRAEQQKSRLDADLQALRQQLLRQAKPLIPADVARRLDGAEARVQNQRRAASEPTFPSARQALVQPLLNLEGSKTLQELDHVFAQHFDLGSYFSTYRLNYPTVFCETLVEFFTPIVEHLNLSAQARQGELERMITQAQTMADESKGGGIFGYNLSGVGCYLNGWLFVYGVDASPRQGFEIPQVLERVMSTAIHEKLGHGFLDAYSALGEVKSRLGVSLADTARRFGYHAADDPVTSLRQDKAILLNMASQLLEEGWATWIAAYLLGHLSQSSPQHHYEIGALVEAIQALPTEIPNRQEISDSLLAALALLFGPEDVPSELLHSVVMIMDVVGAQLDGYFGATLGQPLRYVVGELIYSQAAYNLGPLCVPYAALIAANLSFDPQEISLSDLREMLFSKAQVNPDTRMAALSRLSLSKPNNVKELASKAEAQLSISVPQVLK